MGLEREWKKENAPITGLWWRERIKKLWEEGEDENAGALYSEFEIDVGDSPIIK